MSKSLTWQKLVEHPQQWILVCCVAVLALLIGSEVWFIGHTIFYRPVTPATIVNTETSRDFAERIVAAQLFGRAAASSSNNQAPPETNLQLTLRGVFTAQDPHSASAMIESSDGHVQIVKTGANVASDTVLQQVFSNHVVLMRNGTPETLYFPAPQESAGAVALAQNTASPNTELTAPNGDTDNSNGASPEELKRAAILRRLEELRTRSSNY